MGQIVSQGNRAGKTGEVGIRGVSGEGEHGEDRSNGEVVEPSATHYGGDELGKHTLIAGGSGIGGADAVGAAEQGYSSKENHEQQDDDGECPFSVLLGGFAE